MNEVPLKGLRVLIVEDDYPVAKSLRWLLGSYGADIVGVASSLPAAMEAAAADPPEVALLDVSLNGEDVFPLATYLRENGIPFAFLTGFGEECIPSDLHDHPRLNKPVAEEHLVSTLVRLTAHRTAT